MNVSALTFWIMQEDCECREEISAGERGVLQCFGRLAGAHVDVSIVFFRFSMSLQKGGDKLS